MKPIYVIDDDDDVRDVIVFALESEKHTVKAYENGLVALNALKATSLSDLPGLIIVDNLMPEMDGLTFIKLLKTEYQETLGKIPLILSSAMGQVDVEEPFLKDVLRLYKPMDLEDLLRVANDYCRQ